MNKKYLPIGSIVKLKNKDVLIMVTGYYSVEYEQIPFLTINPSG